MKKKGFTLVELLAVIAILAILVIMALPGVLRMFEQARVDSFNNELNTIVRTAKQQYLLEGGEAKTWSNAEGSTSKLSLTGGSNLKYSVTMDETGKVTKLQATNGSYQYDKTDNNGIDIVDKNEIQSTSNLSGSEVLVIGDSNTKIDIATITVATPGSLSTNDEVEVEGDRFYVVSSSSTETVLLSKYLLNHSNSQQSNGSNTNILTFPFEGDGNSRIAYWDGCKYSINSNACTNSPSGLLSPYNNSYNNVGATTYAYHYPYVYDSNTSLKSYVDAYANKISTSSGVNVTGRLLSHEEAVSLNSDVRTPTNNTAYWLGSAASYNNVWSIGTDNVFTAAIYAGYNGVRPVIVINTDKINLTQGSSGSSGPGSSSGSGSSNQTYTLTYNCNGGSGTAPSQATVNKGSTANLSSRTCNYKIAVGSSGHVYYMLGWNTSSTATTPLSSYTVNGNVTLYAVWSELFTYSGNYYVINDGTGNWRVEFRTGGVLTMKATTAVDIHAVGGGGGGSGTALVNYSGGGGGGGYTTTAKNKSLPATTYTITVGTGGAGGAGKQEPGKPGGDGSESSFGSLVFAAGGKGGTSPARWSTGAGGAGGSGGGSGSAGLGYSYGTGGTNGGNGGNGEIGHNQGYPATCCQGGAGQGATTRDFGETTGTLRAGGGGGGVGNVSNPTQYAAGGEGGGGQGGRFGSAGSNGTANYGGGGGGGSHTDNNTAISSGAGGNGGTGIVIMRNKR